MDSRVIPTFPFIVKYSAREQSTSKESDKKNRFNNFDSSKRHYSTPSHRMYSQDSWHVGNERTVQGLCCLLGSKSP